MDFGSGDGNLSMSNGSIGFLTGTDGDGGFIPVAGAVAAIAGGIAGAIGLGLLLDQMG